MTVADVLSFIVGLLALSAFFVVAIVLTIFLVRETELPETQYRHQEVRANPGEGSEPSPGSTGPATASARMWAQRPRGE